MKPESPVDIRPIPGSTQLCDLRTSGRLSVRATNGLLGKGFDSVDDVRMALKSDPGALRMIRNVGKVTKNEITALLIDLAEPEQDEMGPARAKMRGDRRRFSKMAMR